MRLLLTVLIAVCSLAVVLAGIVTLLRNSEKEENRWFFLLSIVTAAWAIFNYIDSTFVMPSITVLFVKMDFASALVLGFCFLQFVVIIVRSRVHIQHKALQFTRSRAFMAASAAMLSVLAGLSFLGQIVSVKISSGRLQLDYHPIFAFYALVLCCYLLSATLILIWGYIKAVRAEKRRLSLIVTGFIIAITTNLLTNLVFPLILDSRDTIERLNIIGYLGIFTLVLGMYAAIIKRRLFDIRSVLARGLTYLLVILVACLLYSGFITLLSNLVLGGEALSVRTLIVSLTATIIVAFTFQYLIRVISRATNFFLFRGGYDPQQAVKKLSLITSSTLNFEELLRDSVQFLKTTLRLHYCSFIIFGKDNSWRLTGAPDNLDKRAVELLIQYKNRFQQSLLTDEMEEDLFKSQLKRANVDMVQGLYVNNDCVGILILGQKEDGSAYNHQDTWFVTTCAANLAIAIQNAQRFEEIERFNQTLQEKIDDATRQLRRTNDKLRKLDETKDDFISMASHQLRTPLTSVKGYVSMVLDDDAGKINKQQRKLLSQAFISAERMVYLISDLLNVSRLKTGKFVIEPIKTNLARMVEEEVAQLVETAKGRHLELTFHKPEHFPTLMLDETKIRQVMMNFIDNALYYTPAGGHIDIHLADKPETIEFTVADDGIGVPTHEQHHLFSKFYRAPNAKRARPDGTGLGLFMAKKVIIAQGGAIIFKSKEHQGSTFGFTFAKGPLLPPAKETAPASSLAPQKATANK